MEQIIDQLITVGAGLGILAGSWFIWLISGVANNLFSNNKWSWRRMGEDIVKTLLMGIGILSWVVLMNVLDWYTQKLGMDISALLDGATVVGLLAVIVGGSANYAAKAYRNFAAFIGTDHVAKIVGEQDYAGISKDVKDAVGALYSSINTRHEGPEAVVGEVLNKTETKRLAEMGAIPYYKLGVSTPDRAYQSLLGKGFNEGWGLQCVAGFKEFMFAMFGRYVSAGGAAKNYAYEPARSAVCKLGFTWHEGIGGLQDGDWGIWTNGLYGHVAMSYNGKWLGQNQGAKDGNKGNAFNLMALPAQGLVGYFRPNSYAKITKPAISVKNSQKKPDLGKTDDFAPGDRVNVLRYVDVNGKNLLRLQDPPYLVIKVNKTKRQALLQSDDGDIYAWMAFVDITKVN